MHQKKLYAFQQISKYNYDMKNDWNKAIQMQLKGNDSLYCKYSILTSSEWGNEAHKPGDKKCVCNSISCDTSKQMQ